MINYLFSSLFDFLAGRVGEAGWLYCPVLRAILVFPRFSLIFPDFFPIFPALFLNFVKSVLLSPPPPPPPESIWPDHRLQVCWLVKASLRSAFTRQAQPFGQRAGRFAAGSFLSVLLPLLLIAFLALLPQEGRWRDHCLQTLLAREGLASLGLHTPDGRRFAATALVR